MSQETHSGSPVWPADEFHPAGAAVPRDDHAEVLRENRRLRAELVDAQSALADLRERFALLAHSGSETDPRPALREVAALTRLLRELEADQVQAALARGFSYAEIAAELGVTRQSVHQKHPRRSGPAPGAG
jgi:DNA-directed RNA polymerase specialized sigma24 family protein